MRLIDSHAHLEKLKNLQASIEKANSVGVTDILCVSTDITSSRKCLKIAEESKIVHAALGIHPNEVSLDELDDTMEYIESNLDKILAIGEIGLDYTRVPDKHERKTQKKVFTRLLILARDNNLPVSIHSRAAHRDTYRLVKEYGPEQGVFHWYDGPVDVLESIIVSGYYVSATPAIGYSGKHRTALKSAPLDRVLIETDSPVYIRGLDKNAEPADVYYTARKLSELRNTDLEKLARVTSSNAKTLFRF